MKRSPALRFIVTLLIFFGSLSLHAQQSRKVSGSITDTAKTAISGATVLLISEKDTLKSITDSEGYFSFSKITVNKFSLEISSVAYQKVSFEHSFTEKERHKRLEPIELKPSNQMLKEVVIKGKPNPVRFMQDTVEFNAEAFQVLEGDNVADLIKQFPGMEVDDQYNVKSMGKQMVKLRVNGEDFFTGDVNEFIRRLPAGIVSKIQVIDDFGDEANFTGIKVGEPRKLLNIVTKPGMDNGTFGNASANAGSNDMIGSGLSGNLWKGGKQTSAQGNIGTQNNGAGTSRNITGGFSHNDKFGKYTRGGFGYNFGNNSNAFSQEQVMESVYPEGTFVNNSRSAGDNGGSRHHLNGNLHFNNKKLFFTANFNGALNRSDAANSSATNQFGLVRQDLRNSTQSKNSTPNLNASFSAARKPSKSPHRITFSGGVSTSGNNGTQQINTNTLYYNKATGALEKDSVLNRDLLNRSDNRGFNAGFNYSFGFKKPKDSLVNRHLTLGYSGSINLSSSQVSTFVNDNITGRVALVDSLSQSFRSTSLSQSLNLNYNYSRKNFRYNFGINARPNMLSNEDLKLKQKFVNNTFNYAPSASLGKTFAKNKTISASYNGSNNNPSIHQLQPIRNTQNLQNIVVGNPDLKASFNHSMSLSFNYNHAKTGFSVQTGLNASVTQREIVDHVILIPDTLDSYRQITRYENVNGNYGVNANYYANFPFLKNKLFFGLSGNIGRSNRAILFNNQRAFGSGLNFAQRLNGRYNFKKFNVSMNLNYSVTNNNDAGSLLRTAYMQQPMGLGMISAPAFFRSNALQMNVSGSMRLKTLSLSAGGNYANTRSGTGVDSTLRDVSNINLNMQAELTVKKSYHIRFDAYKRINYGYALQEANPMIINMALSKGFLKNTLRFNLSGNDLLAQGNNISRVLSGNTIIDSRTKQQTRVFTLGLSYDLSKFGGRVFRVDAD
ncbi:outer membrane beta-barrel protein [Pedobacter faecalis]|uniref:outer membrane beta-barrel protein n=1 Tax=Pedobacter faecalis TaxID=3041495 RepID=UPI00254A2CD0|nr:outer membrane beta-barrel protein [Pedobacter sp. ELA7]